MTTLKQHLATNRPMDNVRSAVSDAGASPAFVDRRQCPKTHSESK